MNVCANGLVAQYGKTRTPVINVITWLGQKGSCLILFECGPCLIMFELQKRCNAYMYNVSFHKVGTRFVTASPLHL